MPFDVRMALLRIPIYVQLYQSIARSIDTAYVLVLVV
jgi:hypothetical protein